MMTELTFIPSARGKESLLFEDHTFYKFRVNDRVATWRCTFRGCTVTLLVDDSNVLVEKRGTHGHDANIKKVNRKKINAACKRRASDDVFEQPSKIMRAVLADDIPATFTQADRELVRRNMYNARLKVHPFKKPQSRIAVHNVLNEMNVVTCKGEPFLAVNDIDHNIVIFSCQTNLNVLGTMEAIYVDGTFDYCTHYFEQLFTVHGLKNGYYIQLCYAILPNKTTVTYTHFLKKLVEMCPPLNPKHVVLDFETAIHHAILSQWPTTELKGCRFHLRQAWYRRIQKLGLQVTYQKKKSATGETIISEDGRWLRYVFGLVYLKPSEVHDAFMHDLIPIRPQCPKLKAFSDYILEYYLNNDSLFPPPLWACESADLTRTTNACEAFHSHFSKAFYKAHPDIFRFTQQLIGFQTDTYVNIQSLATVRKVRSAYSRKKNLIEDLINQYRNHEITRLQYIKRTGYYLCPE